MQTTRRRVCLRHFDDDDVETRFRWITLVQYHRQAGARENAFDSLEELLPGEVVITPTVKSPDACNGIGEPVSNLIEMISDDGERWIVRIGRIFVVIFAVQEAGQLQ